MFGDGRGFWTNATSALAAFNENLSTALEQIDAELDAQERHNLPSENDPEQVRTDLEAYKALLDEAQMQHFELSKQSRIMIAEKDAEIEVLRAQLGGEGKANTGSEETSLKYKKLLAEKMVLDSSLSEVQEQLKRSLHEKNDYSHMKTTFDDLQTRYKTMKADLLAMKADSEAKEKQKSETIENLVSEYSKLAAESELIQQQADQRVAEVLKENEILVTKMHALEHSITELADRTVSPSPPGAGTSQVVASVSTPSSSKHNSRTDLQTTPSGSSSSLESELREAKSKIVNLQFDIKEKEMEISRLKVVAESTGSASTATGTDHCELAFKLQEEIAKGEELIRKLNRLEQDLDNQSRDLARLNVEKKEADEAGRKYLEQSKRVQAQYDSLVRQSRQKQEEADGSTEKEVAGAESAARCSELQAALDTLQIKLIDIQTQHEASISLLEDQHRAAMETLRNDHAAACAKQAEELSSSKASSDCSHQALVAELETQLANQSAAHTQQIESLEHNLTAQLAVVQAEKEKLLSDLVKKDDEIASVKATFDAQLKATASGSDSERQALISKYQHQIEMLKTDLQTKQNELTVSIAEVESLTAMVSAAAASRDEEILAAKEEEQRVRNELTAVSTKLEELTEQSTSAGQNHEQHLVAMKEDLEKLQKELFSSVAQLEEQRVHYSTITEQFEKQLTAVKQELSEALLDKDVLTDKLAKKMEEMEASKVECQEKLQASLSGSDSERQALVADYMQQIATLKAEVVSVQCIVEQKNGEIVALQEQMAEARTEVSNLKEQIMSLNSQLRVSSEEMDALKSSHSAELQAQAATAAAALDAERASLMNQLKDCEESIGVLRENHREELISELDAQKAELISQHAIAQEEALAAAATAAALAQESSLTAQKEALEVDFLSRENAAKHEAEEAQQAAVRSTTALLQAEKEKELAAQATSHAEALAAALASLVKEKDGERESAIVALRQEKQQELEAAVTECRQLADQQLLAAKTDYEDRAAELNAQITSLKDEIAGIEAKHKELTEKALTDFGVQKDAEKTLALTNLRLELKGEIDAAYKERDEHLENYSKERKLRKKIHNRLLEIQGNIRVLCRIRPILEVERRSGEDVDVTEVPSEEELYVQRDQQCRTRYEYDRVFPQTSTQEEVFEAVQPLCISVLDGYNVCIFAYGQTGSGKTFTMEGSIDNRGVSPRAIAELLNQVEQQKDTYSYTITLSMLEIYNETILDLLPMNPGQKEKEKLEIRQTADGNQVVGLTETTITSMAQVDELMKQGQKNRAVGSHDMNEHSSRSHSIITLICRGKNLIDNTTTYGKLHLIDLAGSERVGKTDATGDRLKEAQNINKSLSALGEVINALGNKKATHVPYRNSKLTFLLQDSLGGNSKVLTFVNISPAIYNLGETVCSLNFATRCRSTELGQAKKQSGPDDSAVKPVRRIGSSASNTSLNSSALLTPAAKK